jgi:hypothetical protein
MNTISKISVGVLVVSGAVAILGFTVSRLPNRPPWFDLVDEKLKSIITPQAPIGNLTPARDLRGTWKSSLAGKGLQVYGKIEAGPSVTTIYEDGDMELIIESVEDNVASGKIRFTNLCATSLTTVPNIKPISVKKCEADSGYLPQTIRVSSSALDFGATAIPGATVNIQGSYLTDVITGTMTVDMEGYGTLKGVFNLSRQD